MSLEAIRSAQEVIEDLAVDMLYFCKFSEENLNDSNNPKMKLWHGIDHQSQSLNSK